MKKAMVKGRRRIQAKNKKGETYEAELKIRFEQLRVLPPLGKRKDYPELTLTVIHALEHGTPVSVRKLRGRCLRSCCSQKIARENKFYG